MTYEEILYQAADGVATVTLNRPEKLNAWTARMGKEVEHAIRAASDDSAVHVIVVTGAGRSFCAGADLSLLSSVTSDPDAARKVGESSAEEDGWATAFNTYLPEVRKPVIAAINGPAFGMGLIFALCCDLRYASSAAKLSTAFSKLGLIAEWGSAWILPRIVGLSRAFDLLYTSRVVEAPEALAMGLVDAVYPVDLFAGEMARNAAHLASNISPKALSVMRRQIYAGLSQTFAESSATANEEMVASLGREDFREGLSAFLEKRAPNFTDR